MRQGFFLLLGAFFLVSCGRDRPTGTEEEGARPGYPNILLILTDDQGWGDLHLNGNDSIDTPVLDRLGRESVRFDRFYVSPLCAPTRASLLTGRYHLRTGVSWVTHRKEVMRSDETTMAEFLKRAGYRTGIFGKWHNGDQYPNDPKGQGFDEFFGFKAGHWNNYFDVRLLHNGDTVQTHGFITDVLTDQAIQFMKTNRDQPFFCYVPFNAPHSPFQVPDRYFDKYKARGLTDKNAAVYGMVENIDHNVERLLGALDELDLAGNTIVVFLTDNGPNGQRYNGGMKGWKGHVDEGGVRVPCFIRWPGHLPRDTVITQLAAHIDLLPTLLGLAGTPYTLTVPLDGRNLMPLMTQQNPIWPNRAIFSIQTNGEMQPYPGAMRTDRYRMVIDRDQQAHLYDMQADPGQQDDLAGREPALTDSLRRKFMDWFGNASVGGIYPPPIQVGNPESPMVELPAPEAALSGNLTFAGGMGWANDYIINWTKPATDSAVWRIDSKQVAPYGVEIEYTASEAAVGARFEVRSGDFVARRALVSPYDPDPLPSPDRVPRDEVYEKVWGRMYLGSFPLLTGPQIITLRMDKALPPGAVEVKAVWVRMEETSSQ